MQTVTIQMTREELEHLIEATVTRRLAELHLTGTSKKRKPHALVSMRRAAEITGMADYQLRYLEDHYDPARSFGYPGRDGSNRTFVETALRKWAEFRRAALTSQRAHKHGLANPIHLEI